MVKTMQRRIPGVILAGGRSSRMFAGGSGDKALLQLGQRSVIEHVIGRLRPQTLALVLNANGDPSRLCDSGLEVIGDSLPGWPGPMAGILAGLRWAARTVPNAPSLVTVPCDCPFVPLDLVARLQASQHSPDQIVLAASSSGRHFVTGLWPLSIADELEQDLRDGKAKASTWVEAHGATFVSFGNHTIGNQSIDPFFNVNTGDDLAIARHWVAHKDQLIAKLFGIAGWKNSGKTTLTVALIKELSKRGYRVATVKCSHHDYAFEESLQNADRRPRDTDLHRSAGACGTGFMGGATFGIVDNERALRPQLDVSGNRMQDLALLIEALADADIILVEGFKAAPFNKIEVRSAVAAPRLAEQDGTVVAVATVDPKSGSSPTEYSRDNVEALADDVVKALGTSPRAVSL
jgi:molybdenum cofactor guanylyltransferase/molybdopterin-guanine dinucleotide biosynthesis protein MobB